ncbi:MAG: hypothetical protein R3195_05150 [Gemmatimonadota bacterium]|nr:hypothetical protein [Gemmatimonadota bacterium]
MSVAERKGRESRESRQRRIVAISFLLSVILHGLILWGTARVGIEPSPYALPPVETTPAPEGLVVVEIGPTPPAEEIEDPRPEPVPPTTDAPARELEVVNLEEADIPGAPDQAVADDPEGAPVAAEEAGMTNADRLRTRFVDARIWFDPRDPFLFGERLERFARADSAVRAILRDWLDSLQLDAVERQRAMDWTFEKDGERWGISPQGLHLGDITIPIPFGFAPTGPRRREFEQAIRDLTEIQWQNLRADVEEVAEERRRAMEERRQEEERRRSGDTLTVRRAPDRPGRAREPP